MAQDVVEESNSIPGLAGTGMVAIESTRWRWDHQTRAMIMVAMMALALLVFVVFTNVTAPTVSVGFGGKGISQTAPPPHRSAQLSVGFGGKGISQTAPPPHRSVSASEGRSG